MNKNKKGFTLVELLVVIAIIGLLATLSVIALNNARAKSRDAKRISDIKQIQTALELYFNDVNQYPASLGTTIATGTPTTTYMQVVPTPPTPPSTITAYTYAATNTGTPTYTIQYTLEGAMGSVSSGAHTADNSRLY